MFRFKVVPALLVICVIICSCADREQKKEDLFRAVNTGLQKLDSIVVNKGRSADVVKVEAELDLLMNKQLYHLAETDSQAARLYDEACKKINKTSAWSLTKQALEEIEAGASLDEFILMIGGKSINASSMPDSLKKHFFDKYGVSIE